MTKEERIAKYEEVLPEKQAYVEDLRQRWMRAAKVGNKANVEIYEFLYKSEKELLDEMEMRYLNLVG